MAKVSNREDALLNAYLSRYKNAQASTVNEGQNKTQTARAKGAALLNATDKTLPVLKDTYSDTLQNIVQGASLENSLNNDVLNRQMKLAQAKFEQANDLYEQQKKAQQYAEKQAEKEAAAAAKAAAKAARSGRSSGKSKSKSGSSADSAESSEDAWAAMDALFGSAASTGGSTASSKPKAGDTKKDETNSEKPKEKSAQEKYLEAKKAGARTTAAKSYAEQNGTGRVSAAQPAQSRAVTKGGKVIASSYAAAGSAPSASESTAAKEKRNDYKSQQEDTAAALKKMQTDSSYRAELAAPGRKLTSAEVAAVNQYEKSTKNTGFSGLKRVFDLAKNSDNLSKEEYAKKSAELNAELNRNSALRGKAQMNGAGQSAQAFTAGLYDSVPFLAKASDAMASAANATGLGTELPMLSKTLEDTKTYDPLAATAGTMAGKSMQYSLFNTAMAGTPLAQMMGKAGNAVVGQAQKIPVLGNVLGAGAGDALGRILTDTTADLALDTLPTLADDLSTYSSQQQAIANGQTVDDALTPGKIAGNTAKNIAGNVAMNALPEIGGAVFNRLKGTAGDAAQDALKQADDAAQDVQNAAPARNIAQPEANGTTGLAAQIQQMNTPDAANRSALNTLDELRSQVDLNGAKEKEAEQLRRAVLQRQQEIGDEAKLALQNSDSLPIDAATDTGYNNINNIGGVTNEAVQGRSQYDGTGSEGILQGSSDGTPQSGQRLAVGAESGEYLPADRVLVAEHLNQRPSVYDDSTRAIAEQAGAGAFDFRSSDDAPETFAQALATAKANNVNGAAVDGHTAEEIANIVNNGGKTFLTPDGTAGGAVEADGNLTCVFKDATNNSTPGAGSSIALAAVNGGATKGDCYGQALVNMYSKAGLEPVARIPYAYGYNDAMDAQVRKQIADGIISKEPDVYALKLRDGYDFEKAAAEFNTAHRYTQAELDALPVYDDYDEMLAYRDSLLKTPLASAGGADSLPMPARADASEAVPGMDIVENARQTAGAASGQNTARPLNGSESVPENAVGAESTQYDRREVVNQDYANQRGMTSGLDEAHLKDLQTENTHQIWTDAEAKKQAEDDISTYIQQAGGDENKALNNAMQDLQNKEHWNKGDSATADEIRDRLKTQFAQTQPGTPEYYAQKARYEAWNQKRSQIRSETAQTMQSFHGDASERVVSVSKPITERWVKNNPVQDEKIKTLSDELAKLKDELRERDIADMEREAMQGVFENGSAAAKQSAGDMNAEFDQMLRDTGVISDTAKNDTTAEFNAITQRVKALCEKHRVNCTDEAAKDIAGRILNGDAAEQYYDKLIMQAAGITDLTPEEMELVDTLYSKAGTMPDSKARYDLEQQAIGIMAKHLPAKSWFERFDNIRYLAMLGNPTTHARNLIGNVLMKGLSDTKDEVAAAMQLVTTKKADRTKALYVPQDMKNAASKWIDENHYTDVLKDGGKFNLDSGLERARSTYGNSKAGRFVQGISDFNSDLLDKEDEIFVKLGATHSLANILTARGYDASIFTKTDEASQQALREALELAKQDAKDVTFHADTALTKAMNSISKAGDKNGTLGDKIAYCIGNGILPFSKTPANILKTAAEYNPVGATVEAMYRGATHKGSAAVTDALAKGVVGSGIMGVGYWLAHEGFLTGTLGEDTKDYDEMLGKQEYSVNIPGVGSYSIDWAAPAIVPLMMGANLEQSGYDLDTLMANPDNFAKMFGQASDIFVNALDPVTDMSMMQSLNNTLDNIRYNDESIGGSIGGLALDAGTSYLKQYMPTIASKATRTIDDTRRSSYGGGSSATERNTNYLLRSTLNKVPVLSKNNEPYIDQWGREEASLDGTDDTAGGMFLRGAYNFGSPGYYSAENVTPVDEYLQGLYGSTNDSHVLPEKASSQIKVDGEGYYMTPKEKTEYAKTSGQTAYDIVDSLRQNDMFLQLPEDQQSALVQDAYSVAKTAGGVAAVGDGVSGTESNEYEAYKDGGVDGLVGFMLMKNATDLVRDEKRETSGNDNADLNTVETWNTLYSQFGDDAVDNFVNSTKEDSTVRNISNLAGDKAVTAYMQAYSAVAKTLDDDQTPDKFTVGYGMQKYGLSGDDFARAYLAAYYKKDKNGKYPEKGGSYADKAGAEIYQSYGADALQDWVNYRATIPDTNGNGKVDKDEAVARLKEMDLTNEMRRAYLAKTNKQWDKKNPF